MKKSGMMLMGAALMAVVALTLMGCGPSNRIDSTLDEMEKNCNQTIKLQAQFKAGSPSVMTEMAALTENYQIYAGRVEAAKGSGMTPAQMQRYTDISAKYQKVLAEQMK